MDGQFRVGHAGEISEERRLINLNRSNKSTDISLWVGKLKLGGDIDEDLGGA